MRKIIKIWSKIFLLFLLIIICSIILILIFLSDYNLEISSTDITKTKNWNFINAIPIILWPNNLLHETLQINKKKKYKKAEMIRQYNLELNRMLILNTSISDIFQDSSTIKENNNSLYAWSNFNSYLVPYIQSNINKNISYLFFPTNKSVNIQESIYLSTNESLAFNIPDSLLRRNLRFIIYPQNPCTLNISLAKNTIGKNTYSRNILETDVLKLLNIDIPLTDISIGKIFANDCNLYIIKPRITQTEKTGRQSIKIPQNSQYWALNNNSIKINNTSSEPIKEENNEEEKLDENNEEENQNQQNENGAIKEENLPEIPVLPVPTPEALTYNPEDYYAINQITNEQISYNGNITLALGYNLLSIQTSNIDLNLLQNIKILQEIAPNIYNLTQNSLYLQNKINISDINDDSCLMLKLILSTNSPSCHYSNVYTATLNKTLENDKQFNLFSLMRLVGYQTAIFASEKALNMNDIFLASNISYPLKWLDKNDWEIIQKRLKIDDQNMVKTGLEAVFGKTKNIEMQTLTTKDYQIMSDYVSKIQKNSSYFPEWHANDLFVIKNNESYLASTINNFQNWLHNIKNTRIFAHILLSNKNVKSATKDLLLLLKKMKISGLISEIKNKDLTNLILLDRSIGQILDTLKAKLLTNRTIIYFIIPHTNKASYFLYIPGLIPKSHNLKTSMINIDDILMNSLQTIGITQNIINDNYPNFQGKSLEKINTKNLNNKNINKNFYKYTMYIRPALLGCNPFTWNSKSNIWNIETNEPIIEKYLSKNIFTIYPCSIKKDKLILSWYQNIETDESLAFPIVSKQTAFLTKLLGGHISFNKNIIEKKDLPIFLFGKNLTRMTDISLSPKTFDEQMINTLFNQDLYHENENKIFKSLDIITSKENKTTIVFYRQIINTIEDNK